MTQRIEKLIEEFDMRLIQKSLKFNISFLAQAIQGKNESLIIHFYFWLICYGSVTKNRATILAPEEKSLKTLVTRLY